MNNNRQQFYFALVLVAIFAVSGFIMLEISNMTTDLALIEGSFYNAVRNGETRLSAEINRGIQDTDFDVLENIFNEIDKDINSL